MKNALRVHRSSLKQENGCYYLNNRVFNGFAYIFSNDGVLQNILEIINGAVKGMCEDKLLSDNERPHIDEHQISFEVGPLGGAISLYKGKEFKGIIYSFDKDGNLLEEAEANVEKGAFRSWYKNGQIKEYYLNDGDSEAWHENGYYRYREFRGCRIGYDANGRVNDITVSSNNDELSFILEGLEYSTSLRLSSQGIDNDLFRIIFTDCQKFVEKYEFTSTNISDAVILPADFSEAKEIIFNNNEYLLPSVAPQLAKRYPLCRIVANGEAFQADKIRIMGERVTLKRNLYYKDTKLVNGIVYDFDSNGKLFGLKEVTQGKITKTLDIRSNNELLLPGSSLPRMAARFLPVDTEHSNEKPERFLVDGQSFCGIIYIFDQAGILVEEAHYHPEKMEYRNYYPSGGIRESLDADGLQAWFENGQIYEETCGPGATVCYNEDGTVFSITDLKERPNRSSFRLIAPGSEVVFRGYGIDDEFLAQVLQNEKLKRLSKMTLVNTNITEQTLYSKRIGKLDAIDIVGNDFISEEAIENFKQINPKCKVTFQL